MPDLVFGVSLANPAGLWLLALAAPIVLLHVLRPRRARHQVRSVLLWSQVSSPVSSASPWQRLVPSWLLLLQLLAVLLLALAVARPVQAEDTPLAAHTVFVIDASASMGANEGTERRIELAADAARDLFDELPDGGVASVVDAGATARVVLTASDDPDAFARAVDGIEVSDGSADISGAFALARSLESPGTPVGFVLVSDGGVDPVALRQIPAGTRYEPVGEETTNRAIRSLTVEPQGGGLHVVASVAHVGGPTATQTVRIDVDGRTEHTESIDIGGGDVVEVAADVPAGVRVEAFLEGEDGLDLDDHAYAVAPELGDVEVAVVGEPDPFLDILFEALPGVSATRADAGADIDADVVVYHQTPVPQDVEIPYWAIAAPSGTSEVSVTGEVERPAVALVDSRDPLLADLDLSELAIATAQRVDAPLATPLVASEGTPLLLRGVDAGVAFVYQSFAVTDSNLPVQLGFPVLGDRILRELAGVDVAAQSLVVGDLLPADVARSVSLERPGGAVVERPPGSGAPLADRAGFWEITLGADEPVTVAVNQPPAESSLAVASSLTIPEPTRLADAAPDLAETNRSLLAWIVFPLLLILVAEALLSRRRLGVTRRQWGVAVAARVVIVALLVGALAGLAVDRPSDRLATMFLLDASDSVGDVGQADALEWIEDAAEAQPDDTLAGLAVFGGDAQLETTMQDELWVGRPAVRIDPTRTDLSGALRLAAAVLPSDARRRIVLVSDGRATEGDLDGEIARLVDDDVVVEFHTVGGGAVGRDVAVADLELPGRVREGEEIVVTARVESTDEGPARVHLLRDGTSVQSRDIELEVGANEVSFTDVAEGSGVVRYQVRVQSSGDTIAENDVAYGAAQIEGPAAVLLVEGRKDGAVTLAAAMEAAGIDHVTVPASELPPVDELAGYSSTILVDVDARDLAPEHLDALVAATRDLGRGLVTVGGAQSYGLGGYRGTELEALLPVESEILDPQRRQTVAEVLAIDTSGSMGACHCAEGAENNGVVDGNSMLQGGVNKTDISRAGAARAIESLSELDEVGILAVDTDERWLIDLQQLPAEEVVTSGLRRLVPSDQGTNLSRSLETSAAALRESDAALKHIILFTDGFTTPGQLEGLEEDAAGLLEEGITVSVVATGEGASQELQAIADAGGGRFYPGRDLQEIPDLIADEAVLASRDFVQEGQFVPQRTSQADPVASLTEAPPILGYVATTARPLATTHLRVGEEADPLLASWQVGLGRATSWTSDLDRWGQHWADWDGFVGFWADVVKDTFPDGSEAGLVRARVDGDVLQIAVESSEAIADGAAGVARIVQPDGEVVEVPLTRSEGDVFVGQATVTQAGSYAVGATVGTDDAVAVAGTALATRSYGAEYVPGDPDVDALDAISRRTNGRGAIDADEAFDSAGLVAGSRHTPLAGWLLLAAALLWPLAVALSRLSVRAGAVVSTARGAGAGLVRRVRVSVPSRPGGEPAGAQAPEAGRPPRGDSLEADAEREPSPPPAADAERPPKPPDSTLGSLLESQRTRRGRRDDT